MRRRRSTDPSAASEAATPLRHVVMLLGVALTMGATVIGSAAALQSPPRPLLWDRDTTDTPGLPDTLLRLAVPDTVEVDSLAPDTVGMDSLAVDSLAADTVLRTPLSDRYLGLFRPDQPSAALFPRVTPPFSTSLGSYWQRSVELDSTEKRYTIREQVGGEDVRLPVSLSYGDYLEIRRREAIRSTLTNLADQRGQRRQQQNRGGLGLNIVVPGGRQSAFSTIFGAPEVDLRVSGQADIRAGFDYRQSDQQAALTGQSSQVDPDFKQDLRLGITGTIGTKLRIDVNWDTNNQFEYQNQVKLQYTGEEDEIIQSIEAGNVFLQTPSRLIRGGQSLFGIKSEFQLGGLRLTTVASQQEGQANNLSIEGGSETREFAIEPLNYEGNTHFFLGYYFRNRWNEALANPPDIFTANGFERITDIEVWRLQPNTAGEQNLRQVIAMVDLGEDPALLTQGRTFTRADAQALPDDDRDQYTDIDFLRSGPDIQNFLSGTVGLAAKDFQQGQFKRLERGRDYSLDNVLGYLSLRQGLQSGEALAISFRYLAGGTTFQVGDFSSESGGSEGSLTEERLVLKLLRPTDLADPDRAAWYLELRNIYPLGTQGINDADFELTVNYEPPGGTPGERVPGVGGSQTLLQLLGLDRVNDEGRPGADNRFDYLPNFTIDPGRGRLIFPTLEPFGQTIADIIEAGPGSTSEKEDLIDTFVYRDLYDLEKENARRNTQQDVYRLRGSFSGTAQEFYDLGAFAGVVEGSVRVTSGTEELQEGIDYSVDYAGGSVTITNRAYLTSGRDIEIDYETNALFNIQQKTLLGLRADYALSERLALGGTLMRLTERTQIDKFRIGEEPISNTIWGVDGSFEAQPRWLTRAVDFLPLLQTRAPSTISISGEYAQLRPGASLTTAFERERRELRSERDPLGNRLDFKADELNGFSIVEDFEGFEQTFSFKQPGAWVISSAPDSTRRHPCGGQFRCSEADSLRTTWRGTMGWYQINRNIAQDLGTNVTDPRAVGVVQTQEVFPNRETEAQDRDLVTLDLYYDPQMRGPYNYTTELGNFLDNPQDTWGGIMQLVPDGFRNFTTKNIEFVEFIFRPFSDAGNNDAGREAKLYVELGRVSEDVLPNAQLNGEDGLSLSLAGDVAPDEWGRQPTGVTSQTINIDNETNRTEDLGLDGVVSYDLSAYPAEISEQVVFADFLNSLDPAREATDPRYRAEATRARQDPSADDYYFFNDDSYFDNSEFFPGNPGPGATIQQRFTRYNPGLELNAIESQNELGQSGSTQGNARYPDTEDLIPNSALDLENSFFQYELPLSRAVLDSLANPLLTDDYVIGEITSNEGDATTGTGWYLVRIPVRDFSRRVGDIEDFRLIQTIRLWTTGHVAPTTLRFATLELVGSQWEEAEAIALEREIEGEGLITDTELSIASVNNEENGDVYRTPPGTVITQIRSTTGGNNVDAREQSMVIAVENLMPGKQRAVSKQYQQADLLRYSNLRMFAHLNGSLANGTNLADVEAELGQDPRSKVRMFVRLGSNETNDFYEYEQPLSPSRLGGANPNPNDIWQTNQLFNGEVRDLNSMNIELAKLNELKVARDNQLFRTDSLFWSDENNVELELERFAPPGTRLGIRGNPNLGRINTIIIGLRNPADSTSMALDETLSEVVLWVNELRVSGYDNDGGWAAVGNADIALADLGRIRGSYQRQTDGFGSLSSTLSERDQENTTSWSVSTDLNLDKFIPERFGWSLPVSFQVQSNTRTPRFAPNRGDVRVDEIVSQIESDTTLTEAQQDAQVRNVIESAQSFSLTRSVTARVQKQNSESRLLRYTLDALSLSYSYSDGRARTPSQRFNDNWRWNGQLNYRFSVRQPRTVRPFGWLGSVPVLGVLGGLQFNYVPNSLNFSATADRSFAESRQRDNAIRQDEADVLLPDLVAFPLQPQHSFSHNRNFGLQYNPFNFLLLSFDTNTRQSLSAVGVDTLFNVVTFDTVYQNVTLDQALGAGLIDSSQVDVQAFEQSVLDLVSTDRVVNRLFSGTNDLRTESYGQRFTGTFRPQLRNVTALNWITIQDVAYSAQYDWRNGAAGQRRGASVSNNVSVRGGLTLRPQELFRKIRFYERLEDAQEQSDQQKQARKREQQQEKERRRAERDAQRLENQRRAQQGLPSIEEEEAVAQARIDSVAVIRADSIAALPDSLRLPTVLTLPDSIRQATLGALPDTARTPALDSLIVVPPDEGRGGFRLPTPNVGGLLRRTALAVTGMRDLQVTYTSNRNAQSSGVGQEILNDAGDLVDVEDSFSLFQALRGNGPSLGYRFGFDRSIDQSERIFNSLIQISDARTDQNQVQARTSLSPSNALTISLNWTADWSVTQNITYTTIQDPLTGVPQVQQTLTENGTNSTSVWAFGADYVSLFAAQLDTYRDDARNAPDPTLIGDTNEDGRVVLTGNTLVDDFIGAFVSGFGTVDSRGLMPFPLPGWNVSYSGLSNWPILRSITRSASLRHAYSSSFSSDFRTNLAAATGDSILTSNLGAQRIQFRRPGFDVNAVRVNERFSPFLGLDLTWAGNIQTQIGWNKSNAYSLSVANAQVNQSKTDEITLSGSFRRQGLRLPFIRRKLNNSISFNLTVARSVTEDVQFFIKKALIDAANDPEFVAADATQDQYRNDEINSFVRWTVAPQISYQLSNRVSATFNLRYERFDSENSLQPSFTNINGGFNFRVSIAN
ncbi:MAG: cell surface protein SprA [Bacteroidota bacterium]